MRLPVVAWDARALVAAVMNVLYAPPHVLAATGVPLHIEQAHNGTLTQCMAA